MQEPLPAVFLLGPPHSGKSVLAYSLSKALRKRFILHYLLRATPDGEGDWFVEAPRQVARKLRIKQNYTPQFVQTAAEHIQKRRVPFLVDPGGRPTPAQIAAIFSQATHAILLLPEGSKRQPWEDILARHHLPLLADLESRLEGKSVVLDDTPPAPLRGVITHLKRGSMAEGPVFEALVGRLAKLFGDYQEAVRARLIQEVPSDAVLVDAKACLQQIRPGASRWVPEDLERLPALLPSGTAVALYERIPVWGAAWVAMATWPYEMYLFDVRHGWVAVPQILPSETEAEEFGIRVQSVPEKDGWIRIKVFLDGLLPYVSQLRLSLPVPSTKKVILDGKMPMWLWVAFARFYHARGFQVGVYQPQVGVVSIKV